MEHTPWSRASCSSYPQAFSNYSQRAASLFTNPQLWCPVPYTVVCFTYLCALDLHSGICCLELPNTLPVSSFSRWCLRFSLCSMPKISTSLCSVLCWSLRNGDCWHKRRFHILCCHSHALMEEGFPVAPLQMTDL